MTSCLSKFYSCQGRNVSETAFISPRDTLLEKLVMNLSLGALRSVRPEFLSWISPSRCKTLTHHTQMISLGNRLETNKTYSAAGRQN